MSDPEPTALVNLSSPFEESAKNFAGMLSEGSVTALAEPEVEKLPAERLFSDTVLELAEQTSVPSNV